MMNIISANQKSITESEADKDAMIPFYSASKAMPPLGIQFQKVNPYITFTGVAAGNSMTFKLPAGSGFLYEASLGFVCTCTLAAGDLVGYTGLNIINQIDFLCNGQPILTMTGYALKALVKTLPAAQQNFIYRYSLPLVPATEQVAAAADVSFLTYTPLIASWLSETQKCLLLDQIGDLQLRVSFATTAQSGLTNAITAITESFLYCQTYAAKLSVMNQIKINDWSKTLIMECFNTYTEVVSLSTVTTVSNYTLSCPFLIYRMHLFVQDVVTTTAVACPYRDINSVTMNLGGVTFLDSYRKSRLVSQRAKNGIASGLVTNNTTVTYDNTEIVTVDFGVQSTRDKNTGTAFLAELRGTNISVTFDTATDVARANLFIVFEYFNNIAYNPSGSGSNGQLSVYQNN